MPLSVYTWNELVQKYTYKKQSQDIQKKPYTSLLSHIQWSVDLDIWFSHDGTLLRVNFWDIDNCLLYSWGLFKKYLERLFPHDSPEELDRVFSQGSKLGNSYREFHRMLRVFWEKESRYIDPDLYYFDFLSDIDIRKKIDTPGYPERWHEQSAEVVSRLWWVAKEVLDEIFNKNPSYFSSESFLNTPLVKLLKKKSAQGELNVLMTANPRILWVTIAKYSWISQYCYALAGDEDMIGGWKEIAIEKLVLKLEKEVWNIHPNRLTVIWDSERWDIGSAYTCMQKFAYTFDGILVRKDWDDAGKFLLNLKHDIWLRDMIDHMDITLVISR